MLCRIDGGPVHPFCQFDYILTGKPDLARATGIISEVNAQIKKEVGMFYIALMRNNFHKSRIVHGNLLMRTTKRCSSFTFNDIDLIFSA